MDLSMAMTSHIQFGMIEHDADIQSHLKYDALKTNLYLNVNFVVNSKLTI